MKTSKPMKAEAFVTLTVLSVSALALSGCATNKSAPGKAGLPEVTIPNGSSPAKANAPRAPMNDTEAMRKGWNHGNGVLWVFLAPGSTIHIDDPAQKDSSYEVEGYSRVKFTWWRGVRGKFTIEGRRLDAPAPPLRSSIPPADSYGDLGFIPSYLYFPAEGYWEIIGHIDEQSLAFVVRVTKKAMPNQALAVDGESGF